MDAPLVPSMDLPTLQLFAVIQQNKLSFYRLRQLEIIFHPNESTAINIASVAGLLSKKLLGKLLTP